MRIEIDQSGKVEDTSKDTILCISNDVHHTVFVSKQSKRSLQRVFRQNGMIRNYVLFTFTALLALLLKQSKPMHHVIIDEEYKGKDKIILCILHEMLDLDTIPPISFGRIGKLSPAHVRAKAVATKVKKPSRIISSESLLRVIKKTDVYKRLENA